MLGSKVQSYLNVFELSSSPHLDRTLDWDNFGVERDLIAIAKELTDWEVKLTPYLQLTPADISDIKEKNPGKPEIQRYNYIGL